MIPPRIAHHSRWEFGVGYARHMRDELWGASFIDFTSSAIELGTANTRAAFGRRAAAGLRKVAGSRASLRLRWTVPRDIRTYAVV